MPKFYWFYLPEIDEAGTVVEADSFEDAFKKGCEMLYPDAGVEVQIHELGESQTFCVEGEVESAPFYSQEDFDAAIMFLTSLTDKGPKQIRALLGAFLTDESITTPRSYTKLNCLTAACRTIRAAPGMSKVFNALKESLLEDN